jgi:hypothetical protein
MEAQKSVYKLGFWSAVLASVFSVAYVIGQLAEWFGLMGSGGGPENDSTWYGLVILLVPSLFLGISFVVMMGSVHRQAPADRRIWSQTGLMFATMYGTLICMNYFVQLTLVAPALYRPANLLSPFDMGCLSVGYHVARCDHLSCCVV